MRLIINAILGTLAALVMLMPIAQADNTVVAGCDTVRIEADFERITYVYDTVSRYDQDFVDSWNPSPGEECTPPTGTWLDYNPEGTNFCHLKIFDDTDCMVFNSRLTGATDTGWLVISLALPVGIGLTETNVDLYSESDYLDIEITDYWSSGDCVLLGGETYTVQIIEQVDGKDESGKVGEEGENVDMALEWEIVIPTCEGMRGNVNMSADNQITLSDITLLVDHLYNSLAPLPCPQEANVNADSVVNDADLDYLIDWVYGSHLYPPADCD